MQSLLISGSMYNEDFFAQAKEQSTIKTALVTKYFWSWAKVMIPQVKKRGGSRIAYADLFCGPGCYDDGTKSTPVLVLETALREPEIAEMLVSIFNDENAQHTAKLEEEIAKIPNIANLAIQPQIENFQIGSQVVDFLSQQWPATLFFIDPFGYKGLSIDLIHSVLKNWGCDCIFFFNYRRINMAIDNPVFQERMNAIFGAKRLANLKQKFSHTPDPDARELLVIETLIEALQEKEGKYVLPFRFRDGAGTRTSHHLIFVSKSVLGYTMMKEIMAGQSSSSTEGVASFEYNQATKSQPLLFALAAPLEELGGTLLTEFAGQTLTVEDVFRQHHVGKRFVRKNYQQALRQLKEAGKITVHENGQVLKEGTLPKLTQVTFTPSKKTRFVQGGLFD